MDQNNAATWEKMELLRRHPKIHAGIVSRFNVEGVEGAAGMGEGEFHEFARHVEDCYRWFWPIGH